MPIKTVSDPIAKLTEISDFVRKSHPGQLLDENLDIIDKTGFNRIKWCLLALAAPFMRYLGVDVYSHVRIHRVAQSILMFCEAHKETLQKTPWVIEQVDSLVYRLSSTNGKYKDDIKQVRAALQRLYPPVPGDYLRIQWPGDLKTIGFTQDQKNVTENVFESIRQRPFHFQCTFHKYADRKVRTLQRHEMALHNDERAIRSFPIPCTMRITYSEKTPGLIERVVLVTKELRGEGGQTRVRKCYDLLTGQKFVKKKTNDYFQKQIIGFLHSTFKNGSKARTEGGLVPIVDTQTVDKMLYFFEPEYAGTLQDLLNRWPQGNHRGMLLPLMRDLLKGAGSLHGLQMLSTTLTRNNGTQDTAPAFNLFHADLKGSNVLVKLVDGVWRAVITDFGSIHPWNFTSSFGFCPPEVVKAAQLLQGSSPFSVKDFKLQYGQKIDIWQIGLLFSMILCDPKSGDEKGFSPLSFIQDAIKNSEKIQQQGKEWHLETKLSVVTQSQILTSINALDPIVKASYQSFLQLMFDGMLRVDPQERATALELLQAFDKITDI